MSSPRRRYPGARPFEEHQADIFRGRDIAVRSLYRLIRQEPLVVVYAKSGIGKSSLLRAGLIPRLRSEGHEQAFLPILIRLYAAESEQDLSPAETTRLAIEQALEGDSTLLQKIIPDEESLWRSLKAFQLKQDAEEIPTLLLIFDQFEELFTYPPAAQLAFRRQLAEALYTKLPQRYWDMLSLYEGQDSPLSPEERRRLQRPLPVHLVMAIREDRIHLLGGLSDYLPTISKNWFELKTLSETEAIDAIETPAAEKGDFTTETFTFSLAARDHIIQFLTRGNEGIESTQLQIICDAIDQRMADRADRLVTPELVSDLDAIIENYYWQKLDDIPDEEQRLAARRLIEEELIFEEAERRLSLFGGIIQQRGVRPETLKMLVDGYLLRAEPDLRGGYNYELSHDSLVGPVLKAKRERKAAEEKERLAKEQILKQLELDALRKQAEKERHLRETAERSARNARRRTWIASILAILAIALGVFAFIQSRNSQVSLNRYRQAEQARLITEIKDLKVDAQILRESEDFDLAQEKEQLIQKKIEQAMQLDSMSIEVRELWESLQKQSTN